MSLNDAGPSNLGVLADIAGPSKPIEKQEKIRTVSHHFEDAPIHLSEDDVNGLMRCVVASIVRKQGYDGISSSAMDYIMQNAEYVMSGILEHTNELAMVARRRIPSIRDAYIALQNAGPLLQPPSLIEFSKERKDDTHPIWKIETRTIKRPELSEWISPEERYLPSDEEEEEEIDPSESDQFTTRNRKRKMLKASMTEVPAHLPPLPPKHTWLSTPSFPIRSEDTMDPSALIDAKVSLTRLTEASLRGLIYATDAAEFSGRERNRQDEVAVKVEDSKPTFKANVFTNDEKLPEGIPSTNDEESKSNRLRKGRALSLRLRSSLTPQQAGESNLSNGENTSQTTNLTTSNAPPRSITFKQSATPSPRHSLSLSLSGPRSANTMPSPSLTFGRRAIQTPSSAGPLPNVPTQSYFTWGPPMPSMNKTPGGEMPLATPLTPGAGFVYPPTPIELYKTNHISGNIGSQKELSEDVSLPGVVNYKRSWYRKGNMVKKENNL